MFDFLSQKFSSLFSNFSGIRGKSALTEDVVAKVLATVNDALLEADVPYNVVTTFVQEVKKSVVGQVKPANLKVDEFLMKVVYDQLVKFLGDDQGYSTFSFQIPSVIMVMGLQGSGKTTSVVKLASFIGSQAREKGKERRILVASVDFYRPAAIEQLKILAQGAQVDFYRAQSPDPVVAAQEIYEYGQTHRYEIIILDTAGRLHVDREMLSELMAIDRYIKPKYKLMVLDSMTGQESLKVAQAFDDGVGFFGAVLTKMDSDTRGGAAFSFRYALKKPILFVGVGEKIKDFERFYPDRIAQRMLGMGDIMTLIEKAQSTIKHDEQSRIESSMKRGKFTLDDFLQQMEMVNQLGSFSQVMKYLPKGFGLDITPEMIEQGEKEARKFKAIIKSMTRKERLSPSLIDSSRQHRIAQGSGVLFGDVADLLSRFQQSQKMMKSMNSGKFSKLFK